MIKLYDYFRSTASYRVRIALNIKKIAYETISVHLINNGGEQNSPQYLLKNPQGLVPCIETDEHILCQSLAIIEYLDEIYPEIPLLPKDPFSRATVRSMALMIACDIHPLNNLRVLNRLKEQFNADELQIESWYHHWLKRGFDALEKKLTVLERTGAFCFGKQITMADICLIPQVYNAKRYQFSLENYPIINEINHSCLQLESFKSVSPDHLMP